MNRFTYELPVKVYFGENCVSEQLHGELEKVGKNIMVVYGGGSIIKNGIYDTVISELKKADKNIVELSGVTANPTYEKALEGIALYKKENIDFILAIGGGSVVDCCKVIAAGAKIDEDIWNMEIVEHRFPKDMASFGVILTLSGAGAEMDCLGAVCFEKINQKKTFRGPYATFVCLDPAYLKSVPLQVFMPGVFDSLTHCLETYFGNGFNVSDRMNLGLMKDILINMKELIDGNDNLEVRSNLMWDASLVQTFLFNVGKPGDFQGHQIENCLGAYSHQTHGKQLAIILPAYYEGQYPYAIEKFALLGKEVFEIDVQDPAKAAKLTIDAIKQLVKDAKLPTTFSELGYELKEEIARKVANTCGIPGNGPKTLSRDEIYTLLMNLR